MDDGKGGGAHGGRKEVLRHLHVVRMHVLHTLLVT